MIFITADEHLGHHNIIRYCNRPFVTVTEMDETIIANHNSVVKPGDTVYHVGDFALNNNYVFVQDHYIRRLNGDHVFLEGSHDKWLKRARQICEFRDGEQVIVLCHYAMRVWPKSHYGSWQAHGHSHGGLPSIGKQYDVGVDNNNFFPVSLTQFAEIMATKEDNPGDLRIRGGRNNND